MTRRETPAGAVTAAATGKSEKRNGDCTTTTRDELRRAQGLMTEAEVAEGYGVSATTLYLLRRAGVIRAVTPRGMTRPLLYRREEMDAWIRGE